jgi:hypothetical protein
MIQKFIQEKHPWVQLQGDLLEMIVRPFGETRRAGKKIEEREVQEKDNEEEEKITEKRDINNDPMNLKRIISSQQKENDFKLLLMV